MQKTKWEYYLLMNICVILLVGCGKKEEIALMQLEPQQEIAQDESVQESTELNIVQETMQEIVVHVAGEVLEEGVYTLPANSRVYQAIEAAGGMSEEAATTYLNQAELLTDGQNIIVPSNEDVEQGRIVSPVSSASNTNSTGKVNINTATKEELMTLTGIGESKALRIIEYREANGQFPSIEALKNIAGIGDATFEKLKERITV